MNGIVAYAYSGWAEASTNAGLFCNPASELFWVTLFFLVLFSQLLFLSSEEEIS